MQLMTPHAAALGLLASLAAGRAAIIAAAYAATG
jgi:hypothetical protein